MRNSLRCLKRLRFMNVTTTSESKMKMRKENSSKRNRIVGVLIDRILILIMRLIQVGGKGLYHTTRFVGIVEDEITGMKEDRRIILVTLIGITTAETSDQVREVHLLVTVRVLPAAQPLQRRGHLRGIPRQASLSAMLGIP